MVKHIHESLSNISNERIYRFKTYMKDLLEIFTVGIIKKENDFKVIELDESGLGHQSIKVPTSNLYLKMLEKQK